MERANDSGVVRHLQFAVRLSGCSRTTCQRGSAAFERLWPKATCTALASANHLPLLMGTAEGMGWQFQAAEATG